MNVGRIVIAGDVKNSTIVTGNNNRHKLEWVANPFNDSLVSFYNGVKCKITYDPSENNYSFFITEETNGATKQLAIGICSDLNKTKNMIEGYFHGMV